MSTTSGLTSTVQFRIDPVIKNDAFAVFEEMGISPSSAMQLFFREVSRTKTLPFIITAHTSVSKKEEGYDEWLYDRLDRTIKMLDSGEMRTHTLKEVEEYIRTKRQERRATRINLAQYQ